MNAGNKATKKTIALGFVTQAKKPAQNVALLVMDVDIFVGWRASLKDRKAMNKMNKHTAICKKGKTSADSAIKAVKLLTATTIWTTVPKASPATVVSIAR